MLETYTPKEILSKGFYISVWTFSVFLNLRWYSFTQGDTTLFHLYTRDLRFQKKQNRNREIKEDGTGTVGTESF
jgi:hypothetical protein